MSHCRTIYYFSAIFTFGGVVFYAMGWRELRKISRQRQIDEELAREG